MKQPDTSPSLFGDDEDLPLSYKAQLRRERKDRQQSPVQDLICFVDAKTGGGSTINYGREGKAAKAILALSCAPTVEEVKACYEIWLEGRNVVKYGASLTSFQNSAGALVMRYRAGEIGEQSAEILKRNELARLERMSA